MSTQKKTTSDKATAKKKAPAKKRAQAKKVPAKKVLEAEVVPEVEVVPETKAPPKVRSVYLHSNSGEKTFNFIGDKDFEAAMKIIESAPSSGNGSRNVPTFVVDGYGFQFAKAYKVTEH